MAGVSRATSFAGLSSRIPLNAAWRTSRSAVQSRKLASITILGATQTTSRRSRSWGGGGSIGGRSALQRLQPAPQLLRHRLRIAGADAAAIAQLAVLVVADDQRPDGVAHDARKRIAHHHELLPVGAFGLDPAFGAAGNIRRIGALRHDAFELHAAGLLQHQRAVVVERLAQPDGRGLLWRAATGRRARSWRCVSGSAVRSAPSRWRRSNT